MEPDRDERLSAEIALLESMYPDQITFDERSQELSYGVGHASLRLRLPDGYLVACLPEVLSANIGKEDLRDPVKESIKSHSPGEEVLDSIILAFNDIVDQVPTTASTHENIPQEVSRNDSKTTTIIFLHHLLNPTKRKLCLSPTNTSLSGVTKPGYPGVLIYSGPSDAVHAQVHELKALNWQAFQVRAEIEGEEWEFKHGRGVIEVEAMGDVVAEVDVRAGRKEMFMEAMRMK